MKKQITKLILISGILLVSCGPSLKVTSDYDKSTDFQKYKTFALFQGNINDAISELNQQRIHTAIRNEMSKKGYQEVASSPDMQVNPVAVFKNKVDINATTNYYGYGGIYRPYYWPGGFRAVNTNYDVRQYKDGALIVDIIDANTKQLIWEGIGNSEVDGQIKDPDTQIPKAISSIMSNFPPGISKRS